MLGGKIARMSFSFAKLYKENNVIGKDRSGDRNYVRIALPLVDRWGNKEVYWIYAKNGSTVQSEVKRAFGEDERGKCMTKESQIGEFVYKIIFKGREFDNIQFYTDFGHGKSGLPYVMVGGKAYFLGVNEIIVTENLKGIKIQDDTKFGTSDLPSFMRLPGGGSCPVSEQKALDLKITLCKTAREEELKVLSTAALIREPELSEFQFIGAYLEAMRAMDQIVNELRAPAAMIDSESGPNVREASEIATGLALLKQKVGGDCFEWEEERPEFRKYNRAAWLANKKISRLLGMRVLGIEGDNAVVAFDALLTADQKTSRAETAKEISQIPSKKYDGNGNAGKNNIRHGKSLETDGTGNNDSGERRHDSSGGGAAGLTKKKRGCEQQKEGKGITNFDLLGKSKRAWEKKMAPDEDKGMNAPKGAPPLNKRKKKRRDKVGQNVRSRTGEGGLSAGCVPEINKRKKKADEKMGREKDARKLNLPKKDVRVPKTDGGIMSPKVRKGNCACAKSTKAKAKIQNSKPVPKTSERKKNIKETGPTRFELVTYGYPRSGKGFKTQNPKPETIRVRRSGQAELGARKKTTADLSKCKKSDVIFPTKRNKKSGGRGLRARTTSQTATTEKRLMGELPQLIKLMYSPFDAKKQLEKPGRITGFSTWFSSSSRRPQGARRAA